MKYIAALAILILVFTLLAGCIQNTSTTTNIENHNSNTATNKTTITNITSENLDNGSSLNDSSEVGYINDNISVF